MNIIINHFIDLLNKKIPKDINIGYENLKFDFSLTQPTTTIKD